MEMPVVPPPWLHFLQPRPIVAGVPAERLLDRAIHEYALDLWILCRSLDQGDMELIRHFEK